MNEAVIVSAVRTPVGKHAGALRDVPPDDLASLVVREAVRRAGIAPQKVDDVLIGCALQAGRLSNIARVALLKAGLPESVPGCTINRLCSSGLEAINAAARQIQTGESQIVVAGGVESMTRAPFFVEKIAESFQRGPMTMYDSFGVPGAAAPPHAYGYLTMGITAENVAHQFHISRLDQDEFALLSQHKAVRAIQEGRFQDEIIPVEVPQRRGTPIVFDTDEHPRPDSTLEKLTRLSPAFKEGGTVTAGNSSGINDGAAAMVLMSRELARSMGLPVLGIIRAFAAAGVDPRIMGIGPVYAVPKALAKAGLSLEDIDVIELNEAFASQSLACIRELGLEIDKVNPNGGAIALGHPLGCSGARIATTLLYEMRRREARFGLAAMCVGGGQGLATIFQRE